MNKSRYGEMVMIPPLEQIQTRQLCVWLVLVTLLTIALVFGLSSTVKADPGAGYSGGVNNTNQVFMYPKLGQSPMQQDRDRYECHMWAMGQTGYDPSLPPLPVRRYTRVQPVPPIGYDTAALGFTGALLGAIIGGYHHAPEGALIGGAIGAMTGIVSDSSRAEAARRIEADQNRQNEAYDDRMEDRASAYRRAMAACLEGRGYSVK
jgi:hypothetical protein